MVEVPTLNPTTLDVSINNVGEIGTKTDQAIAAAMAGTKVTVNLPFGLDLNSNDMVHFVRLDHANITFTSNSWIRAAQPEVAITGSLANKVTLFTGGVDFPTNMFKISGDYRTYVGNTRVKVDTLTHSTADLSRYVPATMIFKYHGKDVSDLLQLKNSPYTIECQVLENNSLPGGLPAMGNVSDDILAMMSTPATRNVTIQNVSYTKTGNIVLNFTVNPIITTYSTKNGFTAVQGLPAIPANSMKLTTIQDGPGTSWSWQIVVASNDRVKTHGAYTSQELVPHIKGDANGEIRLVPIQATEFRHSLGGVPRGTYFDTRSGATYQNVWYDICSSENNLKIILQGSDVYMYLSIQEGNNIRNRCRTDISCQDNYLKELVDSGSKIVLLGNDMFWTESLRAGGKLR